MTASRGRYGTPTCNLGVSLVAQNDPARQQVLRAACPCRAARGLCDAARHSAAPRGCAQWKAGKKELYIPKVFCQKTFREACSWAQPSKPTVLREMFDASELWKAVDSYPSRGHHAEILQQFYKKLLSRISKKRGRVRATQAESRPLATYIRQAQEARRCC